jgi:dolichol-phosphate mannosyltransferase
MPPSDAHLPGSLACGLARGLAFDELPAPASPVIAPPEGEIVIPAAPPGPRTRLSLIIPTFNEATNIEQLTRCLTELLEGPLGADYELIVVDDDSPDRTWERALALAPRFPRLRVMRRTRERGLATAVLRGFQAARGDVLAVIDADLQHPPEITLALHAAIEAGADLAVASRHVKGGGVSDWSARRRLLSRGAQLLGLLFLPRVVGRVSDPMSGYFMVRRRAIAERPLRPLGYKVLVEILARGTIGRIDEIGYVFRERSLGESKVTFGLYLAYLRHLARLRRSP